MRGRITPKRSGGDGQVAITEDDDFSGSSGFAWTALSFRLQIKEQPLSPQRHRVSQLVNLSEK
jgi:hypothetical protein